MHAETPAPARRWLLPALATALLLGPLAGCISRQTPAEPDPAILARQLQEQTAERQRLETVVQRLTQQLERSNQQLKDSQRQAELLQQKLDALAEIERSLPASPRSTAPRNPAAETARTTP
jgi:septal ring factor EnvC (AmiA/AmiB activator)